MHSGVILHVHLGLWKISIWAHATKSRRVLLFNPNYPKHSASMIKLIFDMYSSMAVYY